MTSWTNLTGSLDRAAFAADQCTTRRFGEAEAAAEPAAKEEVRDARWQASARRDCGLSTAPISRATVKGHAPNWT